MFSLSAMSFDLYLIRHGQSANNALPERQRVEDPDLTDEGFAQANALAGRFLPGSLTTLLTSGFLRAMQTTRPLAARLQLRPRIRTELHEVGGCYAGYVPGQEIGRPGMNRATLSREFPEFDLPKDIDDRGWWKSRPYETWEQARVRAREQMDRLLGEFRGTNAKIACVIHADFKALLLERVVPHRNAPHLSLELRNTGVTHLRCSGSSVDLVDFNNVEHLD